VATCMFTAANQACEGLLVVADRRMRILAPPIMIASHEAKFHSIGRQEVKKSRSHFRLRQFRSGLIPAGGGALLYAARFRTAHLFFMASLIRLRAAGDK